MRDRAVPASNWHGGPSDRVARRGREPVLLPTLQGHDDELWNVLIELASLRPNEWTLIGGRMVTCMLWSKARLPPRLNRPRCVGQRTNRDRWVTRAFVADLVSRGFGMDEDPRRRASLIAIAGRASRSMFSAPEGLGARVDLTTTPPNHTVRVPGGTQALARTQLLPVRTEKPSRDGPATIAAGGCDRKGRGR